jgi:hypothetical protein
MQFHGSSQKSTAAAPCNAALTRSAALYPVPSASCTGHTAPLPFDAALRQGDLQRGLLSSPLYLGDTAFDFERETSIGRQQHMPTR